jgi:sugar lactone lactonase YvrE
MLVPAVNRLRIFSVLFLVASLAVRLGAEPVAARAMALAREAAAAADAGDKAGYLAKMEEAVALRPDFPRMLVNLAAAQVANDRNDDALATLDRLAALGLSSPVEKSEDFAPLRELPAFKEVIKKLAANSQPQGDGYIAFSLRDVTGLMEGIAWREKTDEFYFGDVNGRAVWVRNKKDGALRRLTPEGDALLGVFGLAIDEAAGALWAATAAVAAMRGFTPEMDGTAALAEIDLSSGEIRRTIPIVRMPGDQFSHVLGDLALGPDGSVFVTDSGGPILWRLAPGAGALEIFVQSEEFLSLQGVVVAGEGSALVLSDHANGLLRVDLARRAVTRLEPPANNTLIGLDGLTVTKSGEIFAIQNGLRPPRVLRLTLEGAAESVSAVAVVEAAHFTMPAPSLGCLGPEGNFYFIGNAGWTRFENTDGAPTPPRSVPVFRVKLARPAGKK